MLFTKTLLASSCLAATACAAPRVGEPRNFNGTNATAASKPNFIFIITDDQDAHLNSVAYQPKIQEHFAKEGTHFENHYCTIALCCPSRVSLLTGKAAHNTNVTDVKLPYGGYPKFVSEGWNEKYLPVWLQQAGYNTYYTGKLMNGHSTSTYNDPFPAGWNNTNYLIDPGTYIYYNSTTQRDQDLPKNNPGEYSTDIITSNAIDYLNTAAEAGGPFWLGVAPIAPHAETFLASETGGSTEFNAPVAAERHKDLFQNVTVPRTPNFNPDTSSGVGWIRDLPKQNQTALDYNDEYYRKRLQTLQAVDDLIDDVFSWLHAHPDILENTYIVYTADNGYHIGQHRLPPGKKCGIEEDINVPFYIRGPGIEKGKTSSSVSTHTDIVPTFFELAGIDLHDDFDGEPIPVTKQIADKNSEKSEHVNVEFWGTGGSGEGKYFGPSTADGTYKTVRIISDDYNIAYTVWCTNEHELYDMTKDPYQMHNLLQTSNNSTSLSASGNQTIAGYSLDRLIPRIDTLLLTLKTCKGRVCTRPWETLQPDGGVSSLADALDEKYDEFYNGQEKVQFSACKAGYLADFEQPLYPTVAGQGNEELKRSVSYWDIDIDV